MPLARALTARRPMLALLARIVRENGRAYAPRYAAAFAFMFIFAGAIMNAGGLSRRVGSEESQNAPTITLSWDGAEALAGTPADTIEAVSPAVLEGAGRAISMALMTLGRVQNY